MLTDLDEALRMERNRSRGLEEFQAAADVLLQRQFAYRADRGTARAVATVLANRGYFEDLMLAVGRRLVIDDRIGMAGALPFDGRGRRLPLDQTLLLTMRLIYGEGIPARLTEAGEVDTTTEEVVAKLEELSMRSRLEFPRLRDWTRLWETLASFAPGLLRESSARPCRPAARRTERCALMREAVRCRAGVSACKPASGVADGAIALSW